MIRDPFSFHFRRALLLSALACFVAILPVRAEDPAAPTPAATTVASASNPTDIAAPTPSLVVSSPATPLAPVTGLRPLESSDSTPASTDTATSTAPVVTTLPTPPLSSDPNPSPGPTTTIASASPSVPPAPISPVPGAPTAPSPSLTSDSPGTLAANTPPASKAPDAAAISAPATENVTVNLINLMVKRGLISKDDAADLIKQAEQEADAARAQATAAEAAAQKVDLVADQAQKAALEAQSQTPSPAANDEDVTRVPYVPEVVKNQIREEVTQDVLKEDREEHLVKQDNTPDWVKRFRVAGDVRVRFQDDMYPTGNATGQIFNFNAINTGAPLALIGNAPPNGVAVPTFNVDQDRMRLRFRARIGAEIDLNENFTAGMRIGSGSDNSPVTANQTLGGVTGGQGGDFSKYSVWLDRAFIRYEYGDPSDKYFSITAGRFDNPFMSTSMIWSDDIGFDGAVVQGKYKVADGFTPFFAGGAFPVFNTDFNFGTNAISNNADGSAYESYDKWLYAGQVGATWHINQDFDFKGAVAFYDFQNIEGQVSSPVSQDLAQYSGYVGPTDDSRPAFAQKGNTYIYLRDVVPDAALPANTPSYQYFGLATPFREAAITAQLDINHFDPLHIWLTGEFVKNVAFDKGTIENNGPSNLQGPVNNVGPNGFDGGDSGYNIRLNVGKVSLEKLWDWNVAATYRYLESDAVVDGFNDSDFGGASVGGTNVKGYILGGNLALASRVSLGARWLSFDSIAGPPLDEDIFQFDINAKF